MNTAKVKTLLGITVSTWDVTIAALLPGLEIFVREYCHNNFLKDKPSVTEETISFDAGTKAIACTVTDFRADYQIYVQGSLYNDGVKTIDSINGTIVVDEDLVDETAGEEITVSETILPLQVEIVIAKIIQMQLRNKEGLKSKKLGDGAESYETSIPSTILDMLPLSVSSV